MTVQTSWSTTRPMCFARGRNGDVYGVNGLERGVRYDVAANAKHYLGLAAPTVAPSLTSSSGSAKYYVTGVDVQAGGFNYDTTPTVTFTGGGGTGAAAKAELTNSRVSKITMLDYGSGYTSAPEVSVGPPNPTSPAGSGATFAVHVSGKISDVLPVTLGTGYTTPPTITITGGRGSGASISADVDPTTHQVSAVVVIDGGSGYATSSTITVSGGGGSGAVLTPVINPATGAVDSVTITNGGSGYTSSPTLTVVPGGAEPMLAAEIETTSGSVVAVNVVHPGDGFTSTPTLTFSAPPSGTTAAATVVITYTVTHVTVTASGTGYSGAPKLSFVSSDGSGALATCAVDSDDGSITSVQVKYGGAYRVAPTASLETPAALIPRAASLVAVMQPAIRGKYWCAFRFIDATPASRDGPIASSLSPLGEVEVASAAGSISWTLTLTGKDADRTNKIELWRTTADQALVMYRVATLSPSTTSYTDTVSDADLVDPTRTVSGEKMFATLPIVLPNGQVNAYRFTPPPQNKSAVVMFQDRAWYGVDAPGRLFDGSTDSTAAEPNSLYFSEVDEPESVPETNELIIQNNVRGADAITALMPFGAGMVVFQNRHAYRLAYVAQPVIDASVQLICQRGCLNQRCWDTYDGVAYVADAMGMYVLDGTNAVPISDAVDTYWSNAVINFASSAWFFVRVDPVTRIARFFFNESGTYPDRALCYHPLTKAWWLEAYAQNFSSSECLLLGKRQRVVLSGTSTGIVLADDGTQDINASGDSVGIACSIRTGNMSLTADSASRAIRVLYQPTSGTAPLTVSLHYNNSSTARANAISTDRGTGFTTSAGGGAVLDMQLHASTKLQDATGFATCMYAGRVDDRSSGGDRHLAVAYSATRPSGEQITLYGTAIDGVAQ